jgi:hypothetical protein
VLLEQLLVLLLPLLVLHHLACSLVLQAQSPHPLLLALAHHLHHLRRLQLLPLLRQLLTSRPLSPPVAAVHLALL